MIKTFCNNCKKSISRHKARFNLFRNHFCSRICVSSFRRKHARKRKINTAGYVLIFKPNHHESIANYILEHRYIMERHLKRRLKKNEVVHHKGIKYPIGSIENKQDNRIKNLELFKKSKHDSFHSTGRNRGGYTITCYICGKIVKRNPSQIKRTHYQVCSAECRIKLPRIKKHREKNRGKQHYKCAICNKKIIRYDSTKNVKKHYCSLRCKYSKIQHDKLGRFI